MWVEKLKDPSTGAFLTGLGGHQVGALSRKEENQAVSRRRNKCGGSGAVCWLLFAGSFAKGLCQDMAEPHMLHCHPGPQGDQGWRDEPTPQRGELMVYRPPVTWAQYPERDKCPQTPRKVEVAELWDAS